MKCMGCVGRMECMGCIAVQFPNQKQDVRVPDDILGTPRTLRTPGTRPTPGTSTSGTLGTPGTSGTRLPFEKALLRVQLRGREHLEDLVARVGTVIEP